MAPSGEDTGGSSGKKRKHAGSSGGGGGGISGSNNGFKALGLSDAVFRGIVRMGFRVRICMCCI